MHNDRSYSPPVQEVAELVTRPDRADKIEKAALDVIKWYNDVIVQQKPDMGVLGYLIRRLEKQVTEGQ